MSTLEKTPSKVPGLTGKLSTSFSQEERRNFEKSWAPYKPFGIQPNQNGVQVYHWPQGPAAIEVVAKTLLEVAKRLRQKSRSLKMFCDDGYDVYVETVLRNAGNKPSGKMWTLRTNGHAQTDLEMAHALTHDVTRLGVPWQIRNAKDEVIESWQPEEKRV